MLIAAHGCRPDEAFQILSESSQRTNRKLRDLAAGMVGGARQAPEVTSTRDLAVACLLLPATRTSA